MNPKQLIIDTARKYNIPEVDELIKVVYEDYEDFEISQLTAQDVLEIADASGLGMQEEEVFNQDYEDSLEENPPEGAIYNW